MAVSSTLDSQTKKEPLPNGDVVEAFGMAFSNVDFDDMCSHIEVWVRERSVNAVFTPNVDHVVRQSSDDEFRAAYARASLRVVDGMPLVWAARLLGTPLKEKLSGSDLVPWLSRVSAEKGYRIFLFGAAPGVADAAAARLQEQYPGLQIAGTYSPPLGFERDAGLNAESIEIVRQAKADLLFVALGSPRQEIWIGKHLTELNVPVVMGIGATFDFVSGRVKRAPEWVQNCGAEWLWRLAQEPRRLWRRYLVEDSPFLFMFIKEWCASWRRAR